MGEDSPRVLEAPKRTLLIKTKDLSVVWLPLIGLLFVGTTIIERGSVRLIAINFLILRE